MSVSLRTAPCAVQQPPASSCSPPAWEERETTLKPPGKVLASPCPMPGRAQTASPPAHLLWDRSLALALAQAHLRPWRPRRRPAGNSVWGTASPACRTRTLTWFLGTLRNMLIPSFKIPPFFFNLKRFYFNRGEKQELSPNELNPSLLFPIQVQSVAGGASVPHSKGVAKLQAGRPPLLGGDTLAGQGSPADAPRCLGPGASGSGAVPLGVAQGTFTAAIPMALTRRPGGQRGPHLPHGAALSAQPVPGGLGRGPASCVTGPSVPWTHTAQAQPQEDPKAPRADPTLGATQPLGGGHVPGPRPRARPAPGSDQPSDPRFRGRLTRSSGCRTTSPTRSSTCSSSLSF